MKNIFLKLWAVCLSALVLAGCEKPGAGEDGPSKQSSGLLSGVIANLPFDNVTATTASSSCAIDFGDAADMPAEVILEYSLDDSFPSSSTYKKKLEKNTTSVALTELQFDRIYYYHLYIKLYQTEYTLVKGSFETLPVAISLGEPVESEDGLVFSGTLQNMSAADMEYLTSSICIYESNLPETTQQIFPLKSDDAKSFSVTVPGLNIDTDYTYWWEISDGKGKSEKGAEMSYTTVNPYEHSAQASPAGTDLSAERTANCYIVPAAGPYKFKMTKGSSSEPVGNVAAVRILWESFGTAVAPRPFELISATGMAGDYALFEVPQAYKEGNAVIAAYDDQENILWSWHIWLTDDQITADTYYVYKQPTTTEAGGFTDEVAGVVMDRNLGALSSEENSLESFGLLYQWGRKDPFLGSADLAGTMCAKATRERKPSPAIRGEEFAIANPNVFILGNERKDWLPMKNNSLWTNSSKTKYDPCPPGWRVPDGGTGVNGVQAGLWAKIGMSVYGKTAMPASWQSGWKGMKFPISKTDFSSWYPVAGGINLDAQLKRVGVEGTYWSASAIGGDHDHVYAMNFYFINREVEYYEYCSTEVSRATGNSVRCCKE